MREKIRNCCIIPNTRKMMLTYLVFALTVATATGKYLDEGQRSVRSSDIEYCSFSEWGHYKPVQGQCDKFYQCAPIGPDTFAWQEMPCGPGTLWNDVLKICDFPYNVDCVTTTEAPCCNQQGQYVHVDLKSGGVDSSALHEGIEVLQGPVAGNTTYECDHQVLIKANFETAGSNSCVTQSTCGRRLLEIKLMLSDGTKSGHLFDIGDSVSNNGYAGDSNHQQNDCETHAVYPNATIWKNDVCGSGSLQAYEDILLDTTNVDLFVGNQFIRINNNNGTDVSECSDQGCLYALNGQSDNGGVNEDVYIALNRVVDGNYRKGFGICSAQLRWKCGV